MSGPRGCGIVNVSVEHLGDFGFADSADALLDYAPAFEEQQCGNSANVVAHCYLSVFIDVELSDFGFALVFGCNGVDSRRHLAAGAAPFRPEVDEDRHLRLQYLLVESAISESQCILSSHVPS